MKKQVKFQDGKTYRLAKQIKVYQLLDNGFTKTKLGNFKYIIPFVNNENAPLMKNTRKSPNFNTGMDRVML